jgi:hypothetical protein
MHALNITMNPFVQLVYVNNFFKKIKYTKLLVLSMLPSKTTVAANFCELAGLISL